MDIRSYWQEVKRVEAGLPECVWLVSITNNDKGTTPGAVVECDRRNAAMRLTEKTHERATEAQVEAFQGQREAEGRSLAEQEFRRRRQFMVSLPADAIFDNKRERKSGGKE